jgi:hypothetical protein
VAVAALVARAPSTAAFTRAHRRSHTAKTATAVTSAAPSTSAPGSRGRNMHRKERGAVSSRGLPAKALSGKSIMAVKETVNTAR